MIVLSPINDIWNPVLVAFNEALVMHVSNDIVVVLYKIKN